MSEGSERAREAVENVITWIEDADLNATPYHEDEDGMVQSYIITAGRWNRLLKWARIDSNAVTVLLADVSGTPE